MSEGGGRRKISSWIRTRGLEAMKSGFTLEKRGIKLRFAYMGRMRVSFLGKDGGE